MIAAASGNPEKSGGICMKIWNFNFIFYFRKYELFKIRKIIVKLIEIKTILYYY